MAQGRREVRGQRRLSVGTSVASVEAAERFQCFFGPCRPVRRGGESKTLRQEHGPRSDIASGLVIAFDQFRSHRHRVADVRKPFAADAVDGKLASPRRPQINAREIADRIVVFGVAQPPQRYRPGVTGPRGRFRIERRRNPT